MSLYIPLKNLVVYQLARKLSALGWGMYTTFNWETKKIMGDQFIRATDSVGANIVEGYTRYHYLDRVRFYYTSRASLNEAKEHWLELLMEREKIRKIEYCTYKELAERCSIKLNNFIQSTYKTQTTK